MPNLRSQFINVNPPLSYDAAIVNLEWVDIRENLNNISVSNL